MNEPAQKLEAKPPVDRFWRKGVPIRRVTLEAGAVWVGLKESRPGAVDSNVWAASRDPKCRAWFHSGLCYFEHEVHGTAVMSLSKMRCVELDLG